MAETETIIVPSRTFSRWKCLIMSSPLAKLESPGLFRNMQCRWSKCGLDLACVEDPSGAETCGSCSQTRGAKNPHTRNWGHVSLDIRDTINRHIF
jgi:hypothetical protein